VLAELEARGPRCLQQLLDRADPEPVRRERHLRHGVRIRDPDRRPAGGREDPGQLGEHRVDVVDEVDRVGGDQAVDRSVLERQALQGSGVQHEPSRGDGVLVAPARPREHLLGDLDAVDRAGGADAVQQQREPAPAAEAEVRDDSARPGVGRLHRCADGARVAAIEPGADHPPGDALRMAELPGEPGVVARAERHPGAKLPHTTTSAGPAGRSSRRRPP
jgi:hypothetical protein